MKFNSTLRVRLPYMFKEYWHDDYLGIPYLPQGRAVGDWRANGLDCWGLACKVLWDLCDIDLDDQVALDLVSQFKSVRLADANVLDIAMFDKFPDQAHCGVVIRGGKDMLHTTPGAGSCITPIAKITGDVGIWRWQGGL